MQPSSGTPRAWFRLPCAAALAFALAPGGFVSAAGGSNNACEPSQTRPEDTNNTFTNRQRINPCNGDPINFSGRTQDSFRSQTKNDCSVETRSRLRTEAKGVGSQAEYKLVEDQTNVTRFGPEGPPERITDRTDERIIAQNKTGAVPVGVTPVAPASWFQTARTDMRFHENGMTRERTDTRCRCKREDEVPDERCPTSPST
jgi:hypothetical protein